MNPRILPLGMALFVLAAAVGCAKKSNDQTDSASSDPLIASNPVESPPGNLTPQTPWEQAPPPAVPRPRPARRPKASAAPLTPPPDAPDSVSAPAGEPARTAQAPAMNVMWGTFLRVQFAEEISSETVQPGGSWSGTLADSVFVGDRVAFPAGSVVHGTIKGSRPAKQGDHAMLELAVTSIEVGDRSWPVAATADEIVANSPRARNLGAIVVGAAAGALIGKAVGGDKGAVVGGALGGAAAGGVVAKSKGPQVVIKRGATLTFTTSGDVVVTP